MKLIINTDGASRGNPGPSAYGFVIKNQEGVILHQEGKIIGYATNNIAEYTAVLKSLEYVLRKLSSKNKERIEIITDSLLIASQLAGKFKIKNPGLKEIFDQIKNLEIKLGLVSYKNVPRSQNYLADRLANIALDRAL